MDDASGLKSDCLEVERFKSGARRAAKQGVRPEEPKKAKKLPAGPSSKRDPSGLAGGGVMRPGM